MLAVWFQNGPSRPLWLSDRQIYILVVLACIGQRLDPSRDKLEERAALAVFDLLAQNLCNEGLSMYWLHACSLAGNHEKRAPCIPRRVQQCARVSGVGGDSAEPKEGAVEAEIGICQGRLFLCLESSCISVSFSLLLQGSSDSDVYEFALLKNLWS